VRPNPWGCGAGNVCGSGEIFEQEGGGKYKHEGGHLNGTQTPHYHPEADMRPLHVIKNRLLSGRGQLGISAHCLTKPNYKPSHIVLALAETLTKYISDDPGTGTYSPASRLRQQRCRKLVHLTWGHCLTWAAIGQGTGGTSIVQGILSNRG
jgi:hypothetical protein